MVLASQSLMYMNFNFNDLSTWITIVTTALASMGGVYMTFHKIVSNAERKKKRQNNALLEIAKSYDHDLREDMENKLHEIEAKIITLKENVDKDLEHLKETYKSEIKYLGQKVEELRGEIHTQHGQLVALLTKMIGKD